MGRRCKICINPKISECVSNSVLRLHSNLTKITTTRDEIEFSAHWEYNDIDIISPQKLTKIYTKKRLQRNEHSIYALCTNKRTNGVGYKNIETFIKILKKKKH